MSEEECFIIRFSDALARFKHKSCPHTEVRVDETLYYIECANCGQRLNPIGWLIDVAKKGERGLFECEIVQKRKERLLKNIAARNRCKCEHCGKLTKIDKTEV